MSKEHRLSITWSAGSGSVVMAQTITGEGEDNWNGTLDASEANKAVPLSFELDNLQGLCIVTHKNGQPTAGTLKTNSSSEPDQTINLPLIWSKDSGVACPITDDVLQVFLSNGITEEVNYDIFCVEVEVEE